MNKQTLACLVVVACATTSCQQSQPAGPASTTNAKPAAPVVPAAKRFRPEDIGVTLEALAPGALNANGTYTIPVRVTNTGKVVLSGTDNPPVNVGVKIDAVNGTGAVQDFSRTALPAIAPGEAKDVDVRVPIDVRLDGHPLTIELVQEHVAWFSRLGQPGIHVGPYVRCGASLCPAPK